MRVRQFAGLAVVAGLAAACGGDDGSGDGLATASDYTVLGALADIPASGSDGFEIYTGNLVAAGEAAGLERPDSVEDVDAMVQWFGAVTGRPSGSGDVGPVFVPVADVFNHPALPDIETFHETMGWSLLDVETFVEHTAPPNRFSVVAGAYDDNTLPATLVDLGDGVLATGESDEMAIEPGNDSAVDPLGRSLRLAADGERVAVALAGDPVLDWLNGPDETVADDEDAAAVADALDDADVFSAYLAVGKSFAVGASGSPLEPDMIEEAGGRLVELLDLLPPEPFSAVGVGWSADDDGAVITAAYQHSSQAAAETNARALETLLNEGDGLVDLSPLSERYRLVDMTIDETVVILTLRPGPSGLAMSAFRAIAARDVPFLHA